MSEVSEKSHFSSRLGEIESQWAVPLGGTGENEGFASDVDAVRANWVASRQASDPMIDEFFRRIEATLRSF